MAKLEKFMEMPVSELQKILKKNVYIETHQKQLKIFVDPVQSHS